MCEASWFSKTTICSLYVNTVTLFPKFETWLFCAMSLDFLVQIWP